MGAQKEGASKPGGNGDDGENLTRREEEAHIDPAAVTNAEYRSRGNVHSEADEPVEQEAPPPLTL